jgi:hypothetical protein
MKHTRTWTDREADILHDFRLLFGERGGRRGLGWKNQARPLLTAQARLTRRLQNRLWQLLSGGADGQPSPQRKEVSIPPR